MSLARPHGAESRSNMPSRISTRIEHDGQVGVHCRDCPNNDTGLRAATIEAAWPLAHHHQQEMHPEAYALQQASA